MLLLKSVSSKISPYQKISKENMKKIFLEKVAIDEDERYSLSKRIGFFASLFVVMKGSIRQKLLESRGMKSEIVMNVKRMMIMLMTANLMIMKVIICSGRNRISDKKTSKLIYDVI